MEVCKMNLADWLAMLCRGFLSRRRAPSPKCSFYYMILKIFQKSYIGK